MVIGNNREGLKCRYADGAGGVSAPLWIYAASVLKPGFASRAEAKKLLAIRANDPRVVNWPGPIAEYILGGIDEREMRSRGANYGGDNAYMANWLADFYAGIVDRANRTMARFRQAMCQVAVTDDDDFDATKPNFLSKLWHVEFFIARHEAEVVHDEVAGWGQ
jgi:hypothetical protein